jgi:hypothetical protein
VTHGRRHATHSIPTAQSDRPPVATRSRPRHAAGGGAWRSAKAARLAMVERALDRGDTKLAFQPAMRADGSGPIFYEGLIRVLDDTGRIIPARDFMGNVEERDLGRRIDCAALVTGLADAEIQPRPAPCDQHVGQVHRLPEMDGHPAPFQPQSPRRGGTPDPRDHRNLRDADAGNRHRLHGGVARQGRDLRARRFRRREHGLPASQAFLLRHPQDRRPIRPRRRPGPRQSGRDARR